MMSEQIDITETRYYTNRELSWLEFNQRVLEEALDPATPLLERVKFLAIVSSNLDEFFEVRVAGIKQQIDNRANDPGPDGLSAKETFQRIFQRVQRMVDDQYQLWNGELKPALAKENITFHQILNLTEQDRQWVRNYFFNEVFPVLTPLAIDPSHPFPQLLNKSLNLICVLKPTLAEEDERYAIVQVPRALNRLIELPNRLSHQHDFILLSRLVQEYCGALFPGTTLAGAYPFRVTRNSDLYIDDEEVQNLLSKIEEELRNRNRGNAVRLEVEQSCPPEVIDYLLDKFALKPEDCYPVNGPLNLLRLMPLCELEAPSHLSYPTYNAPTVLQSTPDQSFFHQIRTKDQLLHHPYESFSSVVEFVDQSAIDPRVLAIKMTLYRTSGDSPIVKALIRAAENGKQVTVLVELKARFDEANNISWARRMEEQGIHVVYGLVGLKTHCKTLMIVRRDADRIRHYCHLGTGNYHTKTARLYTDLGLFTARPEITSEVAALFNAMTGMSPQPKFRHLLVAPFEMRQRFLEMIEREITHAQNGKDSGIFAKMNSLVDPQIMHALYRASQAGVKVDLIVRGICCLRPGITGLSENITIRSIVDQYLEHSRIFLFHHLGQNELYLGSADWMPRNLNRRVEVIFPVLDKDIKRRLKEEIIEPFLADNAKSRKIDSQGFHYRHKNKQGSSPFRAQEHFMEQTLTKQAEREQESKLSSTQKLIPVHQSSSTPAGSQI
ncbi:MAG: polyphosphate kinase 1 [Verrucomicrobiota bacterium]